MTEKIEESESDYEKALFDYNEYNSTFVNSFVGDLFNDGIIDEVNSEELRRYFASPDKFRNEIEKLTQYYYISSAETHMLYELIEALPTLDYKITSDDKNKSTDKHISNINKKMRKIKHKSLTRDILKQVTSSGTVVGIWLGNKINIYPYVFDNLDYIYPAYRKNGEWVCVVEMKYFGTLSEDMRKVELDNLYPYVTKKDYDNYVKDNVKYKYKELPQERTFVVRTGTLKRNQGLGTSWITSGLYDLQHKKKLKDVERSIANKIINAVAVLTIGKDGNKDYDVNANQKLPQSTKRKIDAGVRSALEKSSTGGITLISIPNYADLKFPDIKTDGLNGKFEDINNDIQSSYGLSGAIMNGTGGNNSSAKMNLEAFYKRVEVVLDNIELEVYQKLLNILVPPLQEDNFRINYVRGVPMTTKEKVDSLAKLNNFGGSMKFLVDELNGVSWEDYLEQTVYETDVLKLQDKFKPYLQSSVMSGSDSKSGRPSEVESTNENTEKNRTSGDNNVN